MKYKTIKVSVVEKDSDNLVLGHIGVRIGFKEYKNFAGFEWTNSEGQAKVKVPYCEGMDTKNIICETNSTGFKSDNPLYNGYNEKYLPDIKEYNLETGVSPAGYVIVKLIKKA